MWRILGKKRNLYTLVLLIVFCEVYITFSQLRSFNQQTVVIIGGKEPSLITEAYHNVELEKRQEAALDGVVRIRYKYNSDRQSDSDRINQQSKVEVVHVTHQQMNLSTQLVKMTAKSKHLRLEVSEVYQRRRHQVESTCSSDVRGRVDRVITYHDTSYCVTHKIGSTFWLRIFRYLFNDTRKGHVKSPFDITKYETHLTKYKHIKEVPLNVKTQEHIFSTFRFMFVREPFARLWSVYIDKFILPDNFFWLTYGRQIRELKKNKTVSTKGDQKPIPTTPKDTKTWQPKDAKLKNMKGTKWSKNVPGKNRKITNPLLPKSVCEQILFKDFLKYIVKVGTVDGSKLDDHFRPAHYGCNPCKFQPDVVGKLETMAGDSRYILTRLGLSWVADVHSRDERVKEEISMLIDFNYELVIKKRLLARCVPIRALADKLWTTFQMNGYIPPGIKITLTDTQLKKKETFLKFVWETYKKANRASEEMKSQRRRHLIDAYKEVPLDVLKGIQRVFKRDFELFDYDPEPADIFKDRVNL